MSWNYRVVKDQGIEDGTDWYCIRVVHYHEEGPIITQSVEGEGPHGETLAELKADLERMLLALELPVLEHAREKENA